MNSDPDYYTGLSPVGPPWFYSALTILTVVVLTSFIWGPVLVIIGGFVRDVFSRP